MVGILVDPPTFLNDSLRLPPHSDQGMKRLQALMKCITIRRTKSQQLDGKPIVNLPPREDLLWKIRLDGPEKTIYEAVFEQGGALFRGFDRKGIVVGGGEGTSLSHMDITHTTLVSSKITRKSLRSFFVSAKSALMRHSVLHASFRNPQQTPQHVHNPS